MIDKKLHILQHSLGVDEYGQGNQYRNHFVTSDGGEDNELCEELVSEGLMFKPIILGGFFYAVTDAGKHYVAENSPKPPKLSGRGKRPK